MKTNFYSVNATPKSLRWPISLLLGVATLVVFAAVTPVAPALTVYPINSGFEEPDLGSGFNAFQYFPTAPGWIFSPINGTGIAANDSAFNVIGATNFNNDNGATSTAGQAAFLQFGDGTLAGGNVAQTITLPAGHWVLNFSLEGRIEPYTPTGIDVFLDGMLIGPTLLPAAQGSFNDVSVNLGVLTAGSYTIAFAGNDIIGGEAATFVDNVSLSTAPDSGNTLALMFGSVAAILGLNFLVRRRKEN
jgi:hypothetical protein